MGIIVITVIILVENIILITHNSNNSNHSKNSNDRNNSNTSNDRGQTKPYLETTCLFFHRTLRIQRGDCLSYGYSPP